MLDKRDIEQDLTRIGNSLNSIRESLLNNHQSDVILPDLKEIAEEIGDAVYQVDGLTERLECSL